MEAGDEVIEAEIIEDDEPTDAPTPVEEQVSEPPARRLSRGITLLLWIAGIVVAILLLIALFLIGTRIPGATAPMPTPTPTPTATPTPTPTALPVGPIEPGIHRWDALLGGECLDSFESAWQDEYTVVDCAAPHPAQLVVRGTFADAPDAAYPGFEQLATRMNLLCTAPSVVNYSVAGAFTDIQVNASYAFEAEDWDAGNRTYFCFLSRSSGEPFTASIAVPQVAAP